MSRRRWRPVTATAVALVAVALACTDDAATLGPEPAALPVPGALIVSLTTPNDDDGAILFSVSGGGITSPTAVASSHFLFFRATGTSSINAVVVGNVTAGPLLSFEVPDVNQASSYVPTITEVAGRDNALRPSLSGYSLSVSRP